jgi:hypothetical protein
MSNPAAVKRNEIGQRDSLEVLLWCRSLELAIGRSFQRLLEELETWPSDYEPAIRA